MNGYDEDLIKTFMDNINYPVTVLGGASSYENIKKISDSFGPLGISAVLSCLSRDSQGCTTKLSK